MAEQITFTTIGQGTPLVFIHGWGLNSGIFQPVAQSLSCDYQVSCVDLPGFGKNINVQPEKYCIEQIAALIAEKIEQPAIFIGWSLGGLVASQIALSHSDKVLALVCLTSSPYFVQEENWPGIKPELLKSFHQQLATDSYKTINGFLRIQAMGSASVRQDIKQIRALLEQFESPSFDVLEHSLSLLETVDLRSKLKDIKQPSLRMYGRLDTLVPKSVIAQIDSLMPNSESYTFHNASHAPFISHPDEFLDILKNWINKQLN